MTTVKSKPRTRKHSEDNAPKDPAEVGMAWAKSLSAASLIIIELLVLGVKLLYTALESLFRTLLPPVEKSLLNEVVLITGAGHGIGRELAFQFAAQGCVVVCWDIDTKGNEDTAKILSEKGFKNNIFTYTCDVANREQVHETADKVRTQVGDVTVLVNNAGILPCRRVVDQKPEEIRRTFDVNVLAHFWTLEAFLPTMVKKNHGHVVAIASMCGIIGIRNAVPYCSSKFAVRGMMESLYEELRASDSSTHKSQVKLTTIYPIMVSTGLVKRPRYRFEALSLMSPDRVAIKVVKAMRRNYREYSIPAPLLALDRIARLLPAKFIQHAKDFLDTGLDPE